MNFEDFLKDEKTQDAVSRNLEIIGEAAANIPKDLQDKYEEVPWKNIKDFRNVLTHQYWKIDLDLIWEVILTKLAPLKKQIELIRNEIN